MTRDHIAALVLGPLAVADWGADSQDLARRAVDLADALRVELVASLCEERLDQVDTASRETLHAWNADLFGWPQPYRGRLGRAIVEQAPRFSDDR